MTEVHAYIILNAIPGMGNRRIQRLVERAGSARAALQIPVEQWPALTGLPSGQLPEVRAFDQSAFLERELAAVNRAGARVLARDDPQFPALLAAIPDAPVVLYVRGDARALSCPAVAIVGARRASVYGLTTAAKLGLELAERGVITVSGMARGIDTAAHEGCLRAGMPTVAVLGSGLQQIYPPENARLFARIGECGAVVSEFPMDALPKPMHFPRRNRVVSGLSSGVVVVEAAAKSGALITAEFALEQGREVFAVPGRIDHAAAAGGLALLQQGAKMVTSVSDILEELEWPLVRQQAALVVRNEVSAGDRSATAASEPSLAESERSVLAIMDQTPVTLDELSVRCGQPVNRMPALLMNLELKHCVRPLPGRRYIRKEIAVIREKGKGKREKGKV